MLLGLLVANAIGGALLAGVMWLVGFCKGSVAATHRRAPLRAGGPSDLRERNHVEFGGLSEPSGRIELSVPAENGDLHGGANLLPPRVNELVP